MNDKMGTKNLFGTKRINGKYVSSRGIYLVDQWGDLETRWGMGLKVWQRNTLYISVFQLFHLFPVLKLIFQFHDELKFISRLSDRSSANTLPHALLSLLLLSQCKCLTSLNVSLTVHHELTIQNYQRDAMNIIYSSNIFTLLYMFRVSSTHLQEDTVVYKQQH